MRSWLNHLALNLGIIAEALFWGTLPVQWSHRPEEVTELSRGTARAWFRWGAGLGERP